MSIYVIGDIQGCYKPFMALLKHIDFIAKKDTLWLAGDLVNRGPENVKVLRYCRDLGSAARVVLGNHDLHLLAIGAGARSPGRKDTIQDVLKAPDKSQLLDWLRGQDLVIREHGHCLSHAGIPHIWSSEQALKLSNEVKEVLCGEHQHTFFQNMYGNQPSQWSDDLIGWDRLRVITNYLTRMRFVDPQGKMDFDSKSGPERPPFGMQPWYAYPRKIEDEGIRFLFGHWAALEAHTGLDRFQALDTGCVWQGYLTAYRVEDGQRFRVSYRATP